MDLHNNLNRILIQINAMERMTRTLRSEIETQISQYTSANIEKTVEIRNGISQLLANEEPFSAKEAVAYSQFAPDVWMGLDGEKGNSSANVALKAIQQKVFQDDTARVSRLSINPVFPISEKPRWMTLESDVDLTPIKDAKQLQIELIGFFDIHANNTTSLPRHVGVTLRLIDGNEQIVEHLKYHVPVTTMPFEHRVVIDSTAKSGINFDNIDKTILILELPTYGNYTYHIDHFAVRSIGV